MNTTISTTLDLPISSEEEKVFEANARLAGRSPADHLKAILFPSSTLRSQRDKDRAKKKGAIKP